LNFRFHLRPGIVRLGNVPSENNGYRATFRPGIDCTVVRIALVPATMRLMGRWNWWLPGWLDRILPNVALEGVESTEGPALVPLGGLGRITSALR
jgi:hypothetical protein